MSLHLFSYRFSFLRLNFESVVVLALVLLMACSMELFFTWPLSVTLTYTLIFFLCISYMLFHFYKYNNLELQLVIPLLSLFLCYVYDIAFVINTNPLTIGINLIRLFCALFLLLSPADFKFKLVKYVSYSFAGIILVSLLGWILYLLDVHLPNYYSQTSTFYEHTVFYVFLLNGTPQEQIVPRFAGFFLEPGHLATTCCFLLYLNKFDLRQFYNIIFLIAVLFSLSLAGYGLLFGSYLLFLLVSSRKKFLGLLFFFLLSVSIVYYISATYNGGDNILQNMIFSRLEIEDGDIVGNNRTSVFFDKNFDRYIETDAIFLGKGRAAYSSSYSEGLLLGSAGMKCYLYTRGLAGTFLILFFLISYCSIFHFNAGWGFFLIFLVANLIRDYPLKELWLYLYIAGMPFIKSTFGFSSNKKL